MSSQIAGVLSLLIALAAVCVTAWQVHTSTILTVNTNSLPAITQIFEEYRSDVFRGHVENIRRNSSGGFAPGGFSALPNEWRDSAYTVCYFFDFVGTLMLFNLVDDEIVISTIASQAILIWRMLEGQIMSERRYRQATYPADASTGFLKLYEHMVAQILIQGGKNAPRQVQHARGICELKELLNLTEAISTCNIWRY